MQHVKPLAWLAQTIDPLECWQPWLAMAASASSGWRKRASNWEHKHVEEQLPIEWDSDEDTDAETLGQEECSQEFF